MEDNRIVDLYWRAQKMQSQKPQKSTENTATPSPIIFFQMQRTRMKV